MIDRVPVAEARLPGAAHPVAGPGMGTSSPGSRMAMNASAAAGRSGMGARDPKGSSRGVLPYRRIEVGSTRVARRTGTRSAAVAHASSITTAMPMAMGSNCGTP